MAGPTAGEPDVSPGRGAGRGLTVLERTSETQGRVRRLRLSGAPGLGVLSVAATALARLPREPVFSVLPV